MSTAHELIHVAHTQQHTHYKDTPLHRLPLIKLTYSNFEEFYTISLDPNFSENAISDDLGYTPRITHSGCALPASKYSKEKAQVITESLKGALIKAAMMLDKLNLAMPPIKAYTDAVEQELKDFSKETEKAYEVYLKVFPSVTKVSEAIKPAISLSNSYNFLMPPLNQIKRNLVKKPKRYGT